MKDGDTHKEVYIACVWGGGGGGGFRKLRGASWGQDYNV